MPTETMAGAARPAAPSEPVSPSAAQLRQIRTDIRGTPTLHVSNSRVGLQIASVLVAYALVGAAAVVVDRTAGWVVAWLLLGSLLMVLPASIHEAVHLHLFRSRRANRLWRSAVSLPLLLPTATYVPFHLTHHVNPDSATDPEGPHRMPSRLMYLVGLAIGGVAFWVELWVRTVLTLAGRPSPSTARRYRRSIAVDTALTGTGMVLAVVGARWSPLVWQLWLMPLVAMVVVWFFVFLLPEHLDEHDRSVADLTAVDSTRTTVSNPLTRWVLLGFNYHAAHHAFPEVPGYQLGPVDARIAPLQQPQWRARGYASWHLDLWRRLPWRAAGPPAETPDLTGGRRRRR